jgi:hypothetical protein
MQVTAGVEAMPMGSSMSTQETNMPFSNQVLQV